MCTCLEPLRRFDFAARKTYFSFCVSTRESFTRLNQVVEQTGIGAAILANICALLVSYAKYLTIPVFHQQKPKAGRRKSVSEKSSEFLCSTAIKRLLAVYDNCHFVFWAIHSRCWRSFRLKSRYFEQSFSPFAIEACIAYIE